MYLLGVNASRLLQFLALVALITGVAMRIRAIDANPYPHGDVHLDALTLHEYAKGGGLTTPIERSVVYRPPTESRAGYPLDQHPPLSILLGAVMPGAATNAYGAMQKASLLASLLLLVGIFLVGLRLTTKQNAMFGVAAAAGSFALADFGGDGAVYTLHAALAMLAVLALTYVEERGLLATIVAGALLGLAYLTNYQALVLLPASCLAIALGTEGGAFSKASLVRGSGLVIGFVAVAAAWWMRNVEVFGDPTWSVNPFYFKWKFGGAMRVDESGALPLLAIDWPDPVTALKNLRSILLVNLRFIVSQSTLWMGALLPLSLYGAGTAIADARNTRGKGSVARYAVGLLALGHLVVMVVWPACKFRYFVPLLGFIAPLAAIGLERRMGMFQRRLPRLAIVVALMIGLEMVIRGRAIEGLIVIGALFVAVVPILKPTVFRPVFALFCFLAMQAVLYVASPTRSTYYDGILVGDSFKRKDEEASDRKRQEELAAVCAELSRRNVTAVMGDIELKHHALARGLGLTVIQPPELQDAAANARAITAALKHYRANYVLVEGEEARNIALTCPGVEATDVLRIGSWELIRIVP